MLRALLRSCRGSPRDHARRGRPGHSRTCRQYRPEVEALEDRRVPTVVTNPVSAFPITVDGQFDNNGEWSDVTPLAFIKEPDGTLKATTTTPRDPQANSFLYTALTVQTPGGPLDDGLYLAYDETDVTTPPTTPGSLLADVTFPIVQNGAKHILDVQVKTAKGPGSFFDVFFSIDGQPAQGLNVSAAAGIGQSPNSAAPHLIVELEVSLRIPKGFASPHSPIPAAGINPDTGLYDPNPQFWTGGFPAGQGHSPNAPDPLGTSALFQINPNGSVTANSDTIVSQVVNVLSPHPVNLKSNALLPFQILSTATFDATKIDPSTVLVNGHKVPGVRVAVGDVNGDGINDLVLEYHVRDLVKAGALKEGDKSIVITATTFDGTVVVGGSALLRLVGSSEAASVGAPAVPQSPGPSLDGALWALAAWDWVPPNHKHQ